MSNDMKSQIPEMDGSASSKPYTQYGKKGRMPRNKIARGKVEYDQLTTNSPKYWNKLNNFSNVTKFDWDWIVGFPVDANNLISSMVGSAPVNKVNPSSMMVLETVVGPGWASSVNDGVNIGLADIMSRVRAALSTSNIGFETADLGMFFAATGSIASLIASAKRLLESRLQSADRNYLYPRGIVKALGDNYDNVYNNINQYAARLNKCIDRYNQMNLIEGFDIYGREYALFHNLFMDEDSTLGQVYAFRQANYYVYADQEHKARNVWLTSHTIDTYLDAIEECLNAWYATSDFYQMNGTLLRAFKEAPRQHIDPFDADKFITPVVDREFLLQIMNVTIVGDINTSSTSTQADFDITQDLSHPNYVMWMPKENGPEKGTALATTRAAEQMLRIFETDPTADDNMEMTRFLCFTESATSDVLRDCGSEIVVGINLHSYDSVKDTLSTVRLAHNAVYFDTSSGGSSSLLQGNIGIVAALSPFRYIPVVHIWSGEGVLSSPSMTKLTWHGVVGDMYNQMMYYRGDYSNLQNVAMRSLWTTSL